MKVLDRYLIKQFIPVFLVASCMFILLLCLVDLFVNLSRYLNFGVSALNIFTVTALYAPKAFSYALPIALLFASAYTLGDLFARNELISIFASGIPFWQFSRSIVVIGLIASVFSFFFDDRIVIPTLKDYNSLSNTLLQRERSDFQADIVVKARGGNLIYAVDFFDGEFQILTGLSIIEQDDEGNLVALVRSQRAHWRGYYWELINAIVYRWEDGILRYSPMEATDQYREDPETFRRNLVNIEELHFNDARLLIEDLRIAGLPFTSALVDFHHRFSFSAVSFVVIMLSISMGGRFRKNIILMSLISSIGAAVVFYVIEMVTMMMARMGRIPVLIGTWFPVFIFIIIGFFLLKTAKT
ncbi:MAG: LptF/LptG family permease [Treponema sp.]|nr:LptF/LptG family permease [Treponema sp.]